MKTELDHEFHIGFQKMEFKTEMQLAAFWRYPVPDWSVEKSFRN